MCKNMQKYAKMPRLSLKIETVTFFSSNGLVRAREKIRANDEVHLSVHDGSKLPLCTRRVQTTPLSCVCRRTSQICHSTTRSRYGICKTTSRHYAFFHATALDITNVREDKARVKHDANSVHSPAKSRKYNPSQARP
jgi:hypothetical protein